MSHDKHGPSIKHTEKPDGSHDQDAVKATAKAAIDDPNLHLEPVTEYPGTFKGRDGVFRIFHASGK